MKNFKKMLALFIAIIMLTSVMTGCQSRGDKSSSSDTSSSDSSKPPKKEKKVSDAIPNMIPEIEEKKKLNADAIGWLQIPQIGLDEVVVFNAEKEYDYYLRRNFDEEPEENGTVFADFRSTFGDGTKNQLGMNTCIYGHTMTDDSSNPKYEIFFGPLHDLRDPEVAKTIPYIFFSTEKENMAFEIFAIFTANSDNADVPYNRNDIPEEDFYKMIKEQVLPRSLYNYESANDVTKEDKILTVSTCIYVLPDGTKLKYPSYCRYAIMAKLVDPDAPLKEEAVLTVNENPLIDQDGQMASK